MNLLICALNAFYRFMRCKQRVVRGVSSVVYNLYEYYTSESEYVFLDKYTLPFPAQSLQINQPHTPKVLLIYNYNTNVFYPYIPNMSLTKMLRTYDVRSLPILSLELIGEDNRTVRDLTTFIENVKYVFVSEVCVLTIMDVVALWSVITRTPVDRDRIRARYITEEGEERTVSVQDNTALTDAVNRDPSANITGEASDSEPK